MNDMSTSTKFHNTTFTVDEIDIDTKRPHVDSQSNHVDLFVKQIKLKESKNQDDKHGSKFNFKSPIINHNKTMKIKQRVLTPFFQNPMNDVKRNLNQLNLSMIASPEESKAIPEIVVTEFFDENNNEVGFENLENMNGQHFFKNNDKQDGDSKKNKFHSNHQQSHILKKTKFNIKSLPCCTEKCDCCNKTILKMNENRIFVSNSVNANLAVDEFVLKNNERKNFDEDSMKYMEPGNSRIDHMNENQEYETFPKILDSYDNDYYLMNEFLSKNTPVKKSLKIPEVKENEYFYFYCSAEKYKEINQKRLIKLEPMIINGQLKNALTLLTLPPSSSDLSILNELFEKNTPLDLKRIETYVMIKKDSIEKHAEHLIRLNDNKFLFMRSIILQGKFPKDWLKSASKSC